MALYGSLIRSAIPMLGSALSMTMRAMSSKIQCFTPPPMCHKKENTCPKIDFEKCKNKEKVIYRCLNPLTDTKKILELRKHPNPFHDIVESPFCCPKCDKVIRLDDKYYRITDKLNRQYTQTWINCPTPYIKPKRVCDYDNVQLPPIERRKFCPKRLVACETAAIDKCGKKGGGRCPKITMPCCKPPRYSSICRNLRKPSDCIKICAPYPAYSECKRDPKKKRHPSECRCLQAGSLCDAVMYQRRVKLLGF